MPESAEGDERLTTVGDEPGVVVEESVETEPAGAESDVAASEVAEPAVAEPAVSEPEVAGPADEEAETVEDGPVDERLLAAHDLARAALGEITPLSSVGDPVDYVVEKGGVVSLRFATTLAGYPGWLWTVSVAVVEDSEPTVLEVELLPADGALLAPEWVPWATRLADYQAAQAAAAEEEADETDEVDGDSDEDDSDDSDLDDEDSDDDETDSDDADDLDADDLDADDLDDGSRVLHAGDVDGVDIDELDPSDDAEDESDEDESDEDESDDHDSDDEDDDSDDSDDEDDEAEFERDYGH